MITPCKDTALSKEDPGLSLLLKFRCNSRNGGNEARGFRFSGFWGLAGPLTPFAPARSAYATRALNGPVAALRLRFLHFKMWVILF